MEGHRKPAPSVMKTLLGEYDASRARAVQWGVLHEKTAIRKYEEERSVVVAESGLWLHSGGFCGASPDGIIDSDKIIEVKCLFSIRNENVTDKIGDDFFITFHHKKEADSADTVDNGAVILNLKNQQGHSYYHQIQSNLWLTGRSVCDFVVWTPSSILVISVTKDELYETKYLTLLEQFYKQYFIRKFIELLNRACNLQAYL